MSCGLRGKDLFFSCALPSQGYPPISLCLIKVLLHFNYSKFQNFCQSPFFFQPTNLICELDEKKGDRLEKFLIQPPHVVPGVLLREEGTCGPPSPFPWGWRFFLSLFTHSPTISIIAYYLFFVNTYSFEISSKFSKTSSGIGGFFIGLFPGYFQAEIIIIFKFLFWYISQIS